VVEEMVLPVLKEHGRVLFVVVDCLRLDQWEALVPLITPTHDVETSYYYSILPTATPYSRNALFAAMLAARGMTGPSPIFEGVGGYFKAVTRAPFRLTALGGREHPFKIMECSIKRFPLGLYSQTVVQAALEARGKIRSVDEIAEVHIETVGTAVRLMAGDPEKWEPATRETADHSMPYTVAVALIYGTIEERQTASFKAVTPLDPAAYAGESALIQALAEKIAWLEREIDGIVRG